MELLEIKSAKRNRITAARSKKTDDLLTLLPRETESDPVWGERYVNHYVRTKQQFRTFEEAQKLIDDNLKPLALAVTYHPFASWRDDNKMLKEPVLFENYTVRSKFQTVDIFLHYYFAIFQEQCATVIVNSKGKFKEHCKAGKNRSLTDLYRICKYYYPTTTLKQVKETLIHSKLSINVFLCNDILRRVHVCNSISRSEEHTSELQSH